MIEQTFNLEGCRTNVDQLHAKIELKFYQAITYFQRYDVRSMLIIEQIAKKQEIFLERKLNKVSSTTKHYIQALIFWKKHSEKSEQIISKWSKLQNQNIFCRPYLQIANHYKRLGNSQKSIQYCSKCLQMFPDNDNAFYYVGRHALEEKNTQQGINLMKIGLEINKSNINILEVLGQYYEEEKRWNDAQRYYQLIIDAQPRNQKRILVKISQLIEKAHNYKQALRPTIKKQKDLKPIPTTIQIKRPVVKTQKQPKKQRMELISKEQVRNIEKNSPIVTNFISPKRKISSEDKQLLKVAKTNSIDTLNAAEKDRYNNLLVEARDNKSDVNAAWKLISFCETINLHDVIYDHIEPIIRYGKRQAHLANRICKKMEQLYIQHPENHRRIAHLFSLLRQFHKKSIFIYLYEVYLSILQENRLKAIEASTGVNLSLFVDEVILVEKQQNLFRDYAFLLGKLINCSNIDLLSLSDLYKQMIGFFERSLNKQEIAAIGIIESLVELKNLLVSSKQYDIKNITLLSNTQTRFVNSYSNDIFIKDDGFLVIIHEQYIQSYLNICDTIIIFPEQLTLISALLCNKRKKFKIYVIKIREFSQEDEVYIARQCAKLSNKRLQFIPNVTFSWVYQHLQNKQK